MAEPYVYHFKFSVPSPEPQSIHDFWTNPEIVIPRIPNSMGKTYFGGAAFPVLYPVSGRIVSITCKYLGSSNVYVDENIPWSEAAIHKWDKCPSLDFDPENPWWRITENLMESCVSAVEACNLECFMGLPDLNGPAEILSGLRNPEKMCLDLILEPERIKTAVQRIQSSWSFFQERYFILTARI